MGIGDVDDFAYGNCDVTALLLCQQIDGMVTALYL